ncbi:MAG: hypothetical protein H6735_33535 [Alphaproteobacteria bacterium]|nr:hypothetical protein [Alphaproteobacteria bacterium]
MRKKRNRLIDFNSESARVKGWREAIRSPDEWAHAGDDLLRCAKLLRVHNATPYPVNPEFDRDWSWDMGDSSVFDSNMEHFRRRRAFSEERSTHTAAGRGHVMLLAMGIECWLKATMCLHGDDPVNTGGNAIDKTWRTHDLRELAGFTTLAFTSDELDVLDELFGWVHVGRYPAETSGHEFDRGRLIWSHLDEIGWRIADRIRLEYLRSALGPKNQVMVPIEWSPISPILEPEKL